MSTSRVSRKFTSLRAAAALTAGALAMTCGVLLTVNAAAAAVCAVPSGPYPTIQDAVNDSTCATINVAAGTYAENVSISRSLVLNGANSGVNPVTSHRGSESTITGNAAILISGPNVFVDGFTITSPTGGTVIGITVKAAGSGAVLRNNIFDQITGTSTAQAILLDRGPDGVVVTQNVVQNVSSPSSAKAIFLDDASSPDPSIGVTIENNSITKIHSDNKGAYGVAVDNGNGNTPNAYLTIQNNKITKLSSTNGWVHAIGLEADTPYVVVTGNTISNLTGPGSDVIAVWFEGENVSFSTAMVNQNDLEFTRSSGVFGIAVDPSLSGKPLNGKCNYWGSLTGPSGVGHGQGAQVTPLVTFNPFLLLYSPSLNGLCMP